MQKINKNKDLKGFIKSIWKEAWGRVIIAVLVMAISFGSSFSLLLSNTRAVDTEYKVESWEQMQSALKELKEGDKATFILQNDLTAKDCLEIGEGIDVVITSNAPVTIYSEDEKLYQQEKANNEENEKDSEEDKENSENEKPEEREKPSGNQAFFRVVGEGKLNIEKSVTLSGG
ncbi:MAG: hypothetical protein IJR47_00240, partial [Clostridia bacterium]|nr:hypothetical protein [Clostridia bacterium]